jgi:thymidylate synthase
MNKLDKDYLEILRDILDNGHKKETRNGGVRSLFGRTIRYKFKDGKFPILTTKKMGFKTIMTELHWFLSGRTDLKYLVDNNCFIWVGDAYKKYFNQTKDLSFDNFQCRGNGVITIKGFDSKSIDIYGTVSGTISKGEFRPYTEEEFINKIKTDDEFSNKWGNLGRIYGAQWRGWRKYNYENDVSQIIEQYPIDQIQDLINEIKANPDSRRLKVTAWNPSEIDDAILPPCHTDFQIYTRELSLEERREFYFDNSEKYHHPHYDNDTVSENGYKLSDGDLFFEDLMNEKDINVPKRTISLLWNQRSADFPLGIPFNIASYGALLCILGKMCNMIPEDLIGNIGDCHIYDNQIDAVNEHLGIDLELEEEKNKLLKDKDYKKAGQIRDKQIIKLRTHRQPFPLPTLRFNDNIKFDGTIDELLESCTPSDFKLENYQSHSAIKTPLSN